MTTFRFVINIVTVQVTVVVSCWSITDNLVVKVQDLK